MYNPKHPITLKSYRISLFNQGKVKFLCAPKSILKDLKECKEVKSIKNIKNIIFMNCSLNYAEYSEYIEFLSEKQSFYNTRNIKDYNLAVLVNNSKKKQKYFDP